MDGSGSAGFVHCERGTIESDLSPFLKEMVDEQRELQMKVGKALDVLRSDYPYF
ncbi:hypothetical protein HJC23_008272 [Cyclotella cryptica]|uniref:Uncharacterized protein n=1 Tax=Cyclotella cryptica TaxID=29204 RepID=A0ABD3PCL8_9STRA